jgi:pyrroline-5-carboxylate reductase
VPFAACVIVSPGTPVSAGSSVLAEKASTWRSVPNTSMKRCDSSRAASPRSEVTKSRRCCSDSCGGTLRSPIS